MLIALCVGILYLVMMLLLPRPMTFAAFFLAFIVVIIGAVLLIVQPITLLDYDSNTWNLILGVFFILLGLLILMFFFCYQQEIELASIFIFYSNVFLKESPAIFLYIVLYIICSFGLCVLCIWQFLAFGTYSEP